jgi:hypothetical protein
MIDTRDKRASVLGLTLAALVLLPRPDAAIDQGDRQQNTVCYRGILATPHVVFVLPDNIETALSYDGDRRGLSSSAPSPRCSFDGATNALSYDGE